MKEINDGGQAFPRDKALQAQGMTLRDYFAAGALATVGAAHTQLDLATWDYNHFAEYAYRIADAMIAEGSK